MIVYLVLFLLLLMDINRSHCPTGINPHTLVYFLLDELHFFSHSKLQENVVVVFCILSFANAIEYIEGHFLYSSEIDFFTKRLQENRIIRCTQFTMYTVYTQLVVRIARWLLCGLIRDFD